MLLDLPAELINVIVGHLAPPSEIPRTHPFGMPDPCPCLPRDDHNRELVLYDSRPEHLEIAYETDAMRFGLAHPYVGACILSGGWRGTVDALFLAEKQDIGVIPGVPEDFRKIIRRINFSLALSGDCQPPAEYLTRAAAATAGVSADKLPTLPSILRKFPAAQRLDINLNLFGREPIVPVYFFVPERRSVNVVSTITEGSSTEQTCQVTELVVSSGDNVGLLALVLSLPRLTTLHVSDSFDIPVQHPMNRYRDYLGLFCHLRTAIDVWQSLEHFDMCLRVTLASVPDHLDIWNLWQTALEMLFINLRSIPSCKIGLCIAYLVESDAPLSIDHAFDRLSGDAQTLRKALAPTSESDVRELLQDVSGYHAVPSFDLSIKYGQKGVTPQELIKVTYAPSPPSSLPSGSVIGPADGLIEFHADREKLGALYRRARDQGP